MNALLFAILLTAARPPFEAQTLDGQTLAGTLTEFNADRVTLQTAAGPVSLETEKLAGLSSKQKVLPGAKAAGLVVELLDGSIVSAQQYVCRNGQAQITLVDGQVIETPAAKVLSVRFQRESEAMAAEWSRLVGAKRNSDLLVIRKDESIDYHKGALQDVTEETVQFNLDGDVLPVKRTKVYGFAYHHPSGDELPAAVCRITDASGSQWSARTVALAEQLQWTTPTGLAVSLPLDKIVQIDFSGGKIVYLSDLKPESVAWKPFFGAAKPVPAMEQFYAPRQDRNFDGGPLQLGGNQYRKGLALHSRTELTYRLPGGFSRFRAVAGIDDALRPNGKVHLVIRGDDKVLLDAAVAGNDPPKPIDVDVAAVRRLTILVDFGDSVNVGDHLLLCNARISK